MKSLIVPAILAALALPASATQTPPASIDQRPAIQQQRSGQATQKGCAAKAQNKQGRKTYREKQDNSKTPKAS